MNTKILIALVALLTSAGGSLCQEGTGLPFDLTYSMSKEQAVARLKSLDPKRIQNASKDTIAYAVPDPATDTVNGLFLNFSADKLVEITTTKYNMNSTLYQHYMADLLDQAKFWVEQGMEVIVEDENDNYYAYKDNRTVVSISGSAMPNESGKFQASMIFTEPNYFQKKTDDR
jgi:hypothetical protein